MKKLTACILAFLLLAFAGVCACADTEILQSGDFRRGGDVRDLDGARGLWV